MADELPFVVCTRVEDALSIGAAPFALDRTTCRVCKVPIVVSKRTVSEYNGRYGTIQPPCMCVQCADERASAEDANDFTTITTPGVLTEAIESGELTPMQIAEMLALMEMAKSANVHSDKCKALVEQMAADPDGKLATDFVDRVHKKLLAMHHDARHGN